MSATWDVAANQAAMDILPLYPEAEAAGPELAARAIYAAINRRCGDLNNRALSATNRLLPHPITVLCVRVCSPRPSERLARRRSRALSGRRCTL